MVGAIRSQPRMLPAADMWKLMHAEGQQNDLIVLGEKGKAQLVRDRANYIRETVADTQKVRITFSQVRPPHPGQSAVSARLTLPGWLMRRDTYISWGLSFSILLRCPVRISKCHLLMHWQKCTNGTLMHTPLATNFGYALQVSAIAEQLMKTEYDVVRIIFNRFSSAISFKPTIATVLSPDALEKEIEAGGKLDQYETEGPDRAEMLQDLAEFQLAAVSPIP